MERALSRHVGWGHMSQALWWEECAVEDGGRDDTMGGVGCYFGRCRAQG